MTEEKNKPLQSVWMVSREYDGLAGAGGVKDVCRQLAEALVAYSGCEVRVILPRYGFMDPARLGFALLPIGREGGRICGRHYEHVLEVNMDYAEEERREKVAIWQGERRGVRLFLVEADRFAAKRGVYTYTEEDEQEVAWQGRGGGHFDYFAMNILLQKTSLDLIILLEEHPDVIHCHDGHAATLPAMMREHTGYRQYFQRCGAVVTIHNAGLGYHQEVNDLDFAHAVTELPWRVIRSSRLGNAFDPFLAAANYALLNTVSENYAEELQKTAEDARTGWLGHTLLERGVVLAGITNGIDPASFDPTKGEEIGLAANYNILAGKLEGKQLCKRDVLRQIAGNKIWPQIKKLGTLSFTPELPLFTFIGRLTTQKGIDVLIQAAFELLAQGQAAQFLFLGSGTQEFEQYLEHLTESAMGHGRACFLKGYNPFLANQVYAGGDFFLIPSRYEPCGLTDYIAQLLGNLPIVHRVGGLVKVIDGKTGFSYNENTSTALAAAMSQAISIYQKAPERLRIMQQDAVRQIMQCHTWQQVMDSYLHLYQEARQRAS